jgi:hypothetical protein
MQTSYRFIQSEKLNGWNCMSGMSEISSRWTAWAKAGTMKAICPINEPGEVYFEFGVSRDQAIERLLKSLPFLLEA